MHDEKLKTARAQVGRCFLAKQLAEELEDEARRLQGVPILPDEKPGECIPPAHVLTPSRVAARFTKVLLKYGDCTRVQVKCDPRAQLPDFKIQFLCVNDGHEIRHVDDLLEELTHERT